MNHPSPGGNERCGLTEGKHSPHGNGEGGAPHLLLKTMKPALSQEPPSSEGFRDPRPQKTQGPGSMPWSQSTIVGKLRDGKLLVSGAAPRAE